MRRLILFIVILLSLCGYVSAQSPENIESYSSNINVESSGAISVTETEVYNFGPNQKHGIIRTIPYIKTNTDGERFRMVFSGFTVTDEKGNSYPKQVTDDGSNQVIKVGDANVFVSGIKTYVIKYNVSGALTYFSDHDELYWNLTGNSTQVPTNKVSSTISLPKNTQITDAICFTGLSGESKKDCTVKITGNKVSVQTTKVLAPTGGVTIAVKFPKDIIGVLEPENLSAASVGAPKSLFAKIIGGIFTTGFLLFGFWWNLIYPIRIFLKWYSDRKNTQKKQKIVAAWFSSPKTIDKRSMTPAETGTLLYKTVSPSSMTATIIDLALRGYLKIIIDEKKKVSFQKIKEFESDSNLLDFEKEALIGIFLHGKTDIRKLDDISATTSFLTHWKSFNEQIYNKLYSNGLFKDKLDKTSMFYSIIGVLALITMNLILAICAFAFGRKSARRTDIGIDKYSEAYSLKNFLVSQIDQFNFQSENQMFFEKLLPFATALGVEKIWAKRFEGMTFEKPDWYEGDYNSALALTVISSSLNSGIKSSTMTSTHSSSGFSSGFSGGSSGGGGGGGGSSSW